MHLFVGSKIILKLRYLYNKVKIIIKPIYEKGFFHLLGANTLLSVFGFISQLFVAWISKSGRHRYNKNITNIWKHIRYTRKYWL